MKARLLLLIQSHAQANALMGCIPHLQGNYDWLWIVYSPAILADPVLVEREFDQQIAEMTRYMKEAYGREDGAGGDAYKVKRDAAILDKAAKVKDAWKTLTAEQQEAAVARIFGQFFAAKPVPNMSISQHSDHFETGAHVELQNTLKAGMKPGFVPGEYVMAWPTSLPREGRVAAPLVPPVTVIEKKIESIPPKDKPGKKPFDPRLKELMMMNLDMLGPIGFELGFPANDPIMGNRLKLAHAIHKAEKAKATA